MESSKMRANLRGGSRSAARRFRGIGFILTVVMLPAFMLLRVFWHHNNSFSADHAWLDYSAATAIVGTSFNSSSMSSRRAIALPALVSVSTKDADAVRSRQSLHEQVGEPLHLGGILDYDTNVLSPRLFELLRRDWGIRSLLDIGCGRGWSTLWFHLQGVSTQCVEASRTALKQSLLPSTILVNHDFTRGPWWPDETVDLVWSTRFVQQVSKPFMQNYFAAMKKAAILVVSFPREPGWHHVEVHSFNWWLVQFEMQGFRYSDELTSQVKAALQSEFRENTIGPNGKKFAPGELLDTIKVFINPSVASLPSHSHLFPELGCYKGEQSDKTIIHRECNTSRGINLESALPHAFASPTIDMVGHKIWEANVRKHLNLERKSDKMWLSGGDGNKLNKPQQPANISHHAVMHIADHIAKGNRTVPKIPIVVWPLLEFGIGTAESLHIETNGIQESPLLHLSDDLYDFDPNVVWVGDTGYAYGWDVWCGKFNEQVLSAQKVRKLQGLPTSWPIYIVDWADYPVRQRCYDVEKTVGREFVFYSKRSMTEGRMWNDQKGWVNHGELLPSEMSSHPGFKYRHTPLIVRTDIIENMQSSLRQQGLTLRDKIETLNRPIDVTHLWPLNPSDPDSGVGTVESKLRTKVSNTVYDLGNATNLSVRVGLAGEAARSGRRGVASSYVDAMLNTKIMIVTQRDQWEDHYRLFEALISGAMVMTDRMLSLPAGLKNGTSIIEFSSEAELRSLITFYIKHAEERLAIAHEGRRVAMSRHRTWHRMEEIIFGRALTLCSTESSTTSSGCPYIVHANETSR